MPICENCNGTGKVPKPINMQEMGEVDCEVCEGTGYLPDMDLSPVLERLDRIIQILEGKEPKE